LARQADEFEQVIFAGCTHLPAVELAEALTSVLPAGLTRVFYSDNGSTAVEAAVKLAYQYWVNQGQTRRRTFVSLHHAYHGDTVGAMSVSEESVFTSAFKPLLFEVARAASPYCYRCPLGLRRESCRIDCLGKLDQVLQELGDEVAAVIIEPMLQGAGGMIMWPVEFLKRVRELCDQYGALMIADEVLTGFGRTGRMFACEHAGITPDIICLSKALTAGWLPLGATVTNETVFGAFLSDDRLKTFFHGHSYTANPLACAVAVESLKIFKEEPVLERVQRLEAQLSQRLEAMRGLPHVGDVRVIGGVGAIELVQEKQSKAAAGYLDQVGPQLSAEFLHRGLLLRPLGNVLYFMPPYVISESETDWVMDQVVEVIANFSWPHD
jgi:adenosylmethionine-8-amino-7-oxononanoate aminotransferase